MRRNFADTLIEQGMRVVMLLVVVIWFGYATINYFYAPYLGFSFSHSTGEVSSVYVDLDEDQGDLRGGDILVEINGLDYKTEYADNPWLNQIGNVSEGDVLKLVVERGENGERISIDWVVVGAHPDTVTERIIGTGPFGLFFLAVGVAAYVSVRPKNVRWAVFQWFCYLAAIILLMVGPMSRLHIGGAFYIYRVSLWLWLAVSIHLHWVFPKPLDRARWLPGAAYIVCGLLAVGELVYRPFIRQGYGGPGLLATFVIILFLLIYRYIKVPEDRSSVNVLLGGVVLAASIPVGLMIVYWLVPSTLDYLAGGGILSLPMLPAAYFYGMFRYQLGKSELRTNRVATFALFFMGVGFVDFILVGTLHNRFVALVPALFIISMVLLIGINIWITVFYYPRFRRWVERRMMGITLPQEEIIQEFSETITVAGNLEDLTNAMQDQILNNLLIRRSALVTLSNGQAVQWALWTDEERLDLPTVEEIIQLSGVAGRSLQENDLAYLPERFQWVRLVLPLRLGRNLLGLWLLGRYDPDDFYGPDLIDSLQALANQTAVAMAALERSDQLRQLIQRNIERQEADAADLSRHLHDGVLNDLTFLKGQVKTPELVDLIEQAIQNLRDDLIHASDELLAYGMAMALEDWLSDMVKRHPAVAFEYDLPQEEDGLPPFVRQQMMRVGQQACNNALLHGQPSKIEIEAQVSDNEAHLTVVDDGQGFDASPANLSRLILGGHYGLRSMQERATLIKARLLISSQPGQGTRVEISWLASEY